MAERILHAQTWSCAVSDLHIEVTVGEEGEGGPGGGAGVVDVAQHQDGLVVPWKGRLEKRWLKGWDPIVKLIPMVLPGRFLKWQESYPAGRHLIFETVALATSTNYKVILNPVHPDCKTIFSRIFYIFLLYLKFLRPEHDCYAKFTSCSP